MKRARFTRMLVNPQIYVKCLFDIGCGTDHIEQRAVWMHTDDCEVMGFRKGLQRAVILVGWTELSSKLLWRNILMITWTGRIIKFIKQFIQCGGISQRQGDAEFETVCALEPL